MELQNQVNYNSPRQGYVHLGENELKELGRDEFQ
jgi:hypothetical protein